MTGAPVFWWSVPLLIFVILPALDWVGGRDETNLPESVYAELEKDWFYRAITFLYLPNQYLALVFGCWCWSGGGWSQMSPMDKSGLMVSVGIMGGIAINAAHELGHKRPLLEVWLSKVALAQTCYGHFYVEHNRGHHSRVATPEDPATARFGENVYGFAWRSVVGGVRSAWRMESKKFHRRGKSQWVLSNDVLNAWLMSVILLVGLVTWFGVVIVPWFIGQAVIGFLLLEVVNYLEHYGLQRRMLPSGRYEPVSPSHSWNSSNAISNVFLFQLQRHSDHHANPRRRYQTLRHSTEAPQLPTGYAGMVIMALIPPVWHWVMDKRVVEFYADRPDRFASQ